MNKVLQIALLDLRIFLQDKSSLFWLFGAPLMFTFFTGIPTQNKDKEPDWSPLPPIAIINNDQGILADAFIQTLEMNGFRLAQSTDWNDADARISIPENFSNALSSSMPVSIGFEMKPNLNTKWEILVKGRVDRLLFRFNTSIAQLEAGERTLENISDRYQKDFVGDKEYVDSKFNDVFPIPMGFNHSFAGNAIMFLTMNLLIFSAGSLSDERRNGILKRLGSFSIHKWEIVIGKIFGRFLLGSTFLAVFLIAGKLLFNVSLDQNFIGIVIVLQVFALFASCLGLFLGSIIGDPEKAIGLCVTLSIVLASLGGCWWPIEVVPDWMQKLASYLPTGMAMNALHGLISFGKPFSSVIPDLLALLSFSLVFATLAFHKLSFDSKKV